jgi:hypothetical protein
MTEFFWDWEYFSVGAVATLLGVCRLQQYGPNGRPESSPSDAVISLLPARLLTMLMWIALISSTHSLFAAAPAHTATLDHDGNLEGGDEEDAHRDASVLSVIAEHCPRITGVDFGDSDGDHGYYGEYDEPVAEQRRLSALLHAGWCNVARSCSQLNEVNLGACSLDAATLLAMGHLFARHGH